MCNNHWYVLLYLPYHKGSVIIYRLGGKGGGDRSI